MDPIDCYFFIDQNKPVEEQHILCLHESCRNEYYPGVGWFYKGSKEGYGPWDFVCHHCKQIIHKAQDVEEDLH